MKTLFGIGICLILALTACIKEGIFPIPDFNYTPEEGSRFSIFYFDASVSFDSDNAIYSLKYRWDFNGDGIFDTDYSYNPKASFKYPVVDCFNVTLGVIDPEGNEAEITKELCVSNKNNAPFATFSILPPIASLGMDIILDASRSFDWEEPPDNLMVRWDIDGDNVWDTEFSVERTLKIIFDAPGYRSISMEIIDSDGASATSEKIIEVVNTYNEYNYLTDHRDGMVYGIVKIGNQWIMAQNLTFGTYVDNLFTPHNNGICEVFAYLNNEENIAKYGALYLYDEVLDYTDKEGGTGFCPDGWHLPSDLEWQQLESYMGMESIMIDSTGWERGPGIGSRLQKNGLSGFEAGLYGYRYPYRVFDDLGIEARFWTSTMEEDGSVWVRGLASWSTGIFRGRVRNNYAYSVRCFKD